MMLTLVASVAFISSCTKETVTPENSTKTNKTVVYTPTNCAQTYQLYAGQTINAGTLTVDNDGTNLYVTYTTTSPNYFNTLHLWVGKDLAMLPTNNGGNPVIGQFPYSFNVNGGTTHTFTIPLANIGGGAECEDAIYVVAHAEWCGTSTETAFGGNVPVNYGEPGRWWRYAEYTICCEEPYNPVCYKSETAWSAGTRYVQKGNWATYTSVSNQLPKTVTLFAGQTMNAGSVNFAMSGMDVQITITLNEGWSLVPGNESVKIQGFTSTPPASNPAPGQFTTYKGNELTVTVPYFNFYGVHVDVQKVVPCQ